MEKSIGGNYRNGVASVLLTICIGIMNTTQQNAGMSFVDKYHSESSYTVPSLDICFTHL